MTPNNSAEVILAAGAIIIGAVAGVLVVGSVRFFDKILKVSRTIADLDNKNGIEKKHILEAVSYKNLQRNYMNLQRVL